MKHIITSIIICITFGPCYGQSGQWQLWASGLPQGAYPRIVVAPNHDLFFTYLGTPFNLGTIFKANTLKQAAGFSELPPIPRPISIQNNIVALGYNALSEPLAGIYRTDSNEPWLFRFDATTQSWDIAQSDKQPSLGAQCISTDSKGNIYVGTRWAYIYKSTDNGKTFTAIDEAAILSKDYPCYYSYIPNHPGYNGSIFGISIDRRDRIYAGTEIAGLIYSDDEGQHWRPVDLFACSTNPLTYDTLSPMVYLTRSGNVAGIGFTIENNPVWSGVDMWYFGWKNELGFADLKDSVAKELIGLPEYLIQRGQQVSKIVTTENGTLFLHSGSSSNNSTSVGIYKSTDGIHWESFNNGITGQNDGLSQGSLAVDGNRVFTATHDGKIWMYDAEITSLSDQYDDSDQIEIYPNPFIENIFFSKVTYPVTCKLYDQNGNLVKKILNQSQSIINAEELINGLYF